ncbi:MAG: cupin domain-containing protein [Burkholderiales bacterium]|nr:cupin domain-containing protein [Burkholderiales bacterium]
MDLAETYLQLTSEGNIRQLPGGQQFWIMSEGEKAAFGDGWLVSEFNCQQDWTSWEMHPQGDEVVYLLSGAVDLWLEEGVTVRTISLRQSGVAVVPRGTWHTARVLVPSRLLHITRGEGTEHRPV